MTRAITLALTTGIALGSATGCITVQVGSPTPATAYHIEAPQAGWSTETSGNADHIFRAADTDAVMGITEACDGVAEQSFESLLRGVVSAIPDREDLSAPEELTGTNIPARSHLVAGTLDTRPVKMLAIVLKSKTCVYDVTLVGKDLSASDQEAARQVARSIKEKSPS